MDVAMLSNIEKQVFVRAPRARVWRALASPEEFSKWFRATVKGTFQPGERVQMTSTYPGHEGVTFFVDIAEVTPEERLSWRWHPGGKDVAGTSEPATLVTFELLHAENGTLVKVVESGFDRLSLERRAKAFESNEQGWEIQTQAIRAYVEETK